MARPECNGRVYSIGGHAVGRPSGRASRRGAVPQRVFLSGLASLRETKSVFICVHLWLEKGSDRWLRRVEKGMMLVLLEIPACTGMTMGGVVGASRDSSFRWNDNGGVVYWLKRLPRSA